MDDDVLGFIEIRADDPANPYEQIRLQILDAIASGRLVAGTRLTPVRALAGRLGVAANTVARAYRELEQAGAVSTRGRNGTVVEASGDDAARHLGAAAAAFADESVRWGIQEEQALDYVRAAFRRR
ncbi:MAG: GntR family transcriptional regulator [Arthrobacter sp.]|uniref:GntR family transcriptional regulator n=1 Tax=Arthrobacter sp. TaxID=1667 RepID=UPI003488D48A